MKTKVKKNVADMRKSPRPHAERVSQLLFNMECEVLRREGEWTLVTAPDDYRGWVRSHYLSQFSLGGGERATVSRLYCPVYGEEKGLRTRLSFGTNVSGRPAGKFFKFDWPDGGRVRIPRSHLRTAPTGRGERVELEELARRFLGIPYLWGGGSSYGFDCSGFVQRLCGYFGLDLPRDSEQQEQCGKRLEIDDLREESERLKSGDLIFFEGHVGLSLGEGEMIHSCRRENGVALTDLTTKGGYSQELREIYRCVRRFERLSP